MAKFNIEFDTVEKLLSVTMDGTTIPNVVSISCYSDGEDESDWPDAMEVVTRTEDEDNKLVTYQRLIANKNSVETVEETANLAKAFGQFLFPYMA